MERLTIQINDEVCLKHIEPNGEPFHFGDDCCFMNNMYSMRVLDKLCKLEDLMERYSIKDYNEFAIMCNTNEEIFKQYNLLCKQHQKVIYERERLKEENQELKKQLENAIISKFKVGQKVWYICYGKIRQTTITSLNLDYIDNEHYKVEYYYNGEVYYPEYNVFATEQEAQQKLKEIKGE